MLNLNNYIRVYRVYNVLNNYFNSKLCGTLVFFNLAK